MRDDRGSAVVDFTLVSVLLVVLFLGIVQLGLTLHTRNMLVSAAQEGARYAANADRTVDDGVARTRTLVDGAIGRELAARATVRPLPPTSADGVPVVGIEVEAPLPLVLLPLGAGTITVRGHAVDEG